MYSTSNITNISDSIFDKNCQLTLFKIFIAEFHHLPEKAFTCSNAPQALQKNNLQSLALKLIP